MGFPLPDLSDGLHAQSRHLLSSCRKVAREKGRDSVKTNAVIHPVWLKEPSLSPLDLYAYVLRLAQNWVVRYPLFDTQGNFGTLDGDPPCAMRYNEIGLSSWTKDFPEPGAGEWRSSFPQLLANGAFAHSGDIETDAPAGTEADSDAMEPLVSYVPTGGLRGGVLRSFIPSHNLKEVSSALLHLLDHPDATLQEILEILRGPDFATGGILVNPEDLVRIYQAGEGTISVRARWTLEQTQKGRTLIVISEIPYERTKTGLITSLGDSQEAIRALGIADLRDLSHRDQMRLELELKKDQPPHALVDYLQRKNVLEHKLEIRMRVLKDGQDVPVRLLDLLKSHLEQRRPWLASEKRLRAELKDLEGRGDHRRTKLGSG